MGNAGIRQTGSQVLPDPRTYMQNDFPKFIYQERIGNGKFMKSFLMKIDGTLVSVKVYLKPVDEDLEQYAAKFTQMWKLISPADYPSLLPYQMWISSDNRIPKVNLTPVYLVRQYFPSNLYDRLSTRPFLINMEKLWIIFQLMKALEQCHEQGVVHGDIKPENVLTTSWNWAVLTDFALHKPVAIPDDDTTTFHYFFDSMARRRCYIAPERFYTSGRKLKSAKASASLDKADQEDDQDGIAPPPASDKKPEQSLTPAMDVFSLGCTIAEVLLDGECLIDLPSLLQYISMCREKKDGAPFPCLSDPDSPALSTLNRIKDPRIRKTISLMTQFPPSDRLSVVSYRRVLEEKGVFPSFFSSVLYDLFVKVHWHGTTPDDRVNIICQNYPAIMDEIANCEDADGCEFFTNALMFLNTDGNLKLERTIALEEAMSTPSLDTLAADFVCTRKSNILDGEDALPRPLHSTKVDIPPGLRRAAEMGDASRKSTSASANLMKKVRETIDKSTDGSDENTSAPSLASLISDFERLLRPAAKPVNAEDESKEELDKNDEEKKGDSSEKKTRYSERVYIEEDTKLFDFQELSKQRPKKNIISGDGIFLVIQIICSSIRYMRHPQSKIVSLMLMARLGLLCQDSVKLMRIIPFVLSLLEDPIASVRAVSIRTLKVLLLSVTEIQPLEANIFEQCIFPALSKLVNKDAEVLVRVTFAECMGKFAEASKRFLNIVEFSRLSKANETDGAASNSSSEKPTSSATSTTAPVAGSSDALLANQYDAKLARLHEVVGKWIRDLILDAGMVAFETSGAASNVTSRCIVRRALLKDLVVFCSFFGTRERIMDFLLVHILSYVNHQDWESDWELRRDFCTNIPGVCTFLGPTVASEWVLPCIENVRVDVEEIVVSSSIQCITSLIRMNLLSNSVIFDSFQKTVPLLVHPCEAIRQSCIDMTVATAQNFGVTDAYVYVLPCIRPLLKCDMIGVEISRENLNISLVAPLSRRAFQKSLRTKVMAVDVLTSKSAEDEVSMSGILVDIKENEDSKTEDNADTEIKDETTVQSTSSSINNSGSSTCDESQAEESMLLGILDDYIVAVGHNLNARKSHWLRENTTQRRKSLILDTKNKKRGRPSAAPGSRLLGTSVPGLSNSHVDGHLLEVFSFQTLQGLGEVHSVMVPHQKYNIYNYASEATRLLASENSHHAINDIKVLKKMYGIISRRSNQDERGETEQGSASSGSDDSMDVQALHKIIDSLKIPPLSPELGSLVQPTEGRKFSIFMEHLDTGSNAADGPNQQWRPKENTVVATMYEHTQAVNRLAVAQDQTFFVSASSDHTAKVWQMKGIERNAFPKSSLTYEKHKGKILDVAMVENSHSVASCSDDGTIHVWRVDLECNKSSSSSNSQVQNGQNLDAAALPRPSATTVLGSTVIKRLNPNEGPILGVQHFSSDVASVLTYCTLGGKLHSWDLRSSQEPFSYDIRPELGFPTSMTASPDRNWMCIGTSKGFIGLWDVRYNTMCQLWKHSAGVPIQRLASAKGHTARNHTPGRQDALPSAEGGYLFVAAGLNEAAVWGVPDGGECLKCFRSVPMLASSRSSPQELPSLIDIPIPSHSLAPFESSHVSAGGTNFFNSYINPLEKTLSVRAIMGRISHSSTSYLITAGTDHHIRYWDFNTPSRCFTVSGLNAAQPKPVYESPQAPHMKGKLFMCYDSKVPTPEATLQAQLPVREYRGVTAPLASSQDAVLDLKGVELPVKMMLSSGRDGIIKLWR